MQVGEVELRDLVQHVRGLPLQDVTALWYERIAAHALAGVREPYVVGDLRSLDSEGVALRCLGLFGRGLGTRGFYQARRASATSRVSRRGASVR